MCVTDIQNGGQRVLGQVCVTDIQNGGQRC